MIGIIDYGMGNLHSVCNALEKCGLKYVVSDDINVLQNTDGLILPGVGAFYDCMKNLKVKQLDVFMKEEVKKGKPLLGICLGMQVLFEKGYEVEECDGLALLKGEVVKMEDVNVKIPHMGWNRLEMERKDEVFNNTSENPFVYYVHSFYAQNYDENDLVAYSIYGSLKICGYVRKNNIMGMQYHPEKSGDEGLAMLKAFARLCA